MVKPSKLILNEQRGVESARQHLQRVFLERLAEEAKERNQKRLALWLVFAGVVGAGIAVLALRLAGAR